MKKEDRWVSMQEICEYLGASKDTIKKMINTQNMPACKMDRKWKFKISEVDYWMHNNNSVKNANSEVRSNVKDD